jgi:glycosyltransferase involved in cell wall biosynthesis
LPRILAVSQSGVYGGAEFQLVELATQWGSSARVVLFTDGPVRTDLAAAGVGAVVLDEATALMDVRRETRRPSAAAVRNVVRLARRIAREAADYDLIYANTQKAFIVAAIAAVLARKPLIWNLHDILDQSHFSRLNTRIAVLLANLTARRILANSQATADAFVARGGARHKVRAIPYGISAAPFLAVDDAEVAAERRALGLGNGPILGVFGRLAHWKGQHVALAALAALPADVQLLIVGDAMFGETRYAEEVRRQADTLGIASRAHFLGFRTDIPVLMRLVDIVVHTSIAAEPFGRVILEGMLAERAVIATDAGGAREIVKAGDTGLLVAPGDPDALRLAIQDLLRDPARRRAMGEAGRRRAISDFGPGATVQYVDAQLREVMQ